MFLWSFSYHGSDILSDVFEFVEKKDSLVDKLPEYSEHPDDNENVVF